MTIRSTERFAPHRPAPHDGAMRRRAPSARWLMELVWRLEHGFERARANARPEEDTRVRIFVLLVVFSLVFAALAIGAAHAALFAPKRGIGGGANPAAVSRADLVDRNGRLLASNITHYGLYIDPAEIWDRELAFDQIRQALPRVSRNKLRRALFGSSRIIVEDGLTPNERTAVHDLALGGVSFEPEDRRVYPLSPSSLFVVGRADAGGAGLSGAEKSFDADIRAAGQEGQDFALSIDLRVQGVLENEVAAAAVENKAKGAVGIVADAMTGEVLGLTSWPAGAGNQVVSSTFEMGSVFKTFTIASAVDAGAANLTTMLDATEGFDVGGGRTIQDFHATHRVLSLEEVYLHSSNIGTSRLAVQMGAGRMQDYFGRFGFLAQPTIELPQLAKPRTPSDWSNSTLASMSYGYAIAVSPIQLVQAMNVIGSGGRFVPLTLRPGGRQDVQPRQVLSAGTVQTMLYLMRRNVVAGSGKPADAPGLRVGGKTGSANKLVGGRYDPSHGVGTFAALFPVDAAPGAHRYSIIVLLDEPTSGSRLGGAVSAPAVGRIADRIAPFLNIQRQDDPWRTATGAAVAQPEPAAAQ
ncbi:peptidoglycan D,D-transpeptidase FtsI family protein [Brevundimonas sp. Leaf363]|uniref:peptidoglycan D,D-transpeptidase FtsI family protein n=1 Tax=Brevundimonas sp. Leaf363 TaxID=1736353 RepID=UPI000AEFC25F